jgi:hypothetical protein
MNSTELFGIENVPELNAPGDVVVQPLNIQPLNVNGDATVTSLPKATFAAAGADGAPEGTVPVTV